MQGECQHLNKEGEFEGRFMEFEEVTVLNNLTYCRNHLRDVCHDCTMDFVSGLFPLEFKLPENGQPEYPVPFDEDDTESALMAKRWLDMLRETYSVPVPPLRSSHVQLPKKLELGDGEGVRENLPGVFDQVLLICKNHRYFFEKQPGIMLQDFETLEQATFLHEANLLETLDRKFFFMSLSTGHIASELQKKARASYVSTFGLFMELITQMTFWKTMELTAQAYIGLLDSYDEEKDDHVLLTEKIGLLEWIGEVFWSFKHGQHVLDALRKQQHMVYQRGEFPFYPCDDIEALEDGLDAHLIIAKLSRGPAHDFRFMASAFDAFRRANDEFPEQMAHVSSATMGAIDEMSARFRLLELLTRAGCQIVATTSSSCDGEEVKAALLRFKFDSTGVELSSAMDDASTVIADVDDYYVPEYRAPTPKNCSYLQELLALQLKCRIKHKQKLLTLPVQMTSTFTKEMLDAFKRTYTKLHRDSIGATKNLCSLLKLQAESHIDVQFTSRSRRRKCYHRSLDHVFPLWTRLTTQPKLAAC